MEDQRDLAIRQAAFKHLRTLANAFDYQVPVSALREGFRFEGERVSYGSFYSGIFKPRQFNGSAALAMVTTPPKASGDAPYADEFHEDTATIGYRFRDARTDTRAAQLAAARDNDTLRAAHALQTPMIYFAGIEPGIFSPVFPVFVREVDEVNRLVLVQVGLPMQDLDAQRPTSGEDVRAYATREVMVRLHQQGFRRRVLHAYRRKCAICTLREAPLLQAAHIVEDRDLLGHADVVNGISLCAIHHLAYDRNLLGIDPTSRVHIAHRLLREVDGPMLKSGIQEFHGAQLLKPRHRDEQPDPDRLEIRYERFKAAAA